MKRKITTKEEYRIKKSISEKISWFAPTISPAPKSVERNEIESLYEAINYYKNNNQSGVIIQPKYMGSYCDIYLNKNLENTKFFSRNGYPISSKMIDRGALLKAVSPFYYKMKDFWNDGAEIILIQSELLPWSALGKGLIDGDFKSYSLCHQSNLDYLKSSNLKSLIGNLSETGEFKEFCNDLINLNKNSLNEKYSHHVIGQYKSLQKLIGILPDLEKYQSNIDLYNKQVNIYGQDDEISFSPFNILKIIYSNGAEIIWKDNLDGFKIFSDNYHFIDFNKEVNYDKAYSYYSSLIENNMEGVIVKPIDTWVQNIAPMFKVRNNNYLQMIYGINFNLNYNYYLERRSVNKKIKCSINEWKIAQSILNIKYSELIPTNKEYYNLIVARILEEYFEQTLDVRL